MAAVGTGELRGMKASGAVEMVDVTERKPFVVAGAGAHGEVGCWIQKGEPLN